MRETSVRDSVAAEDDAASIDVDLDLDSTSKAVVAFRYCQSELVVETFPSEEEERTFEIPQTFHSVVAVLKELFERTKEAFLEEAK